AIDAQGRIILVGNGDRGLANFDFAVARLNPDGSLDTSFDGDGKQTVAFDLGFSNSDTANSLAIDPQGRIVLVGCGQRRHGDYDFAVARLNPDGSLDTSFDGDGKQTVAFDRGGGNNDQAFAMAIDAQGRIVLAGSAQLDITNDDFAVARL